MRQWLISEGFQGKEGQTIPEMTKEKVASISARYIELYENITGEKFKKDESQNIYKRMEQNILTSLK